MYVCICHAVTDRDIHQAVSQGASSVSMVCEMLEFPSGCGRCQEQTAQVVGEAISKYQPSEELRSIHCNAQELCDAHCKAS